MRSFVEYRGEQIAYQARGKGRAMVLIHGFLASSELWAKFLPRLAKHFKVITIDLPGHGQSSAIGYVHDMELMAEVIKTVLNQLNIRKAVLAGHSLGGYVALAFAEKYPDSLLGLILINSTAKGDSAKKRKSRDQLIKLLKQNKDSALRKLIPTFFNVNSRNTHWHKKKYLQWARSCSVQGIIATIEGMKVRKEREIVLKFAPFPYLYLVGNEDQILSAKVLQEESELGEVGVVRVFDDCGHMAPFEKPEYCLKHIKNFGKKLNLYDD